MWGSWVKSPARIHHHHHHQRAPSFSDTLPPPSPLHHHSSFKDVETLLLNTNHPLPPLSPLHKHSLSFKPSPDLTQTRHPQQPVSFKDIQSLLSSDSFTKKPSIFHRVRAWAARNHHHPPPPPDSHNRAVIYYTSLHVVRKTFYDCRAVRSILKGYRVKIDERDVSMDKTFLDQLHSIIGNANGRRDNNNVVGPLPRVFVNGVYVGGAEEIRRLHENGDLKRLIQGLPKEDGAVCRDCGGFRFVLCEVCDGSRKVYRDKLGFKTCSRCNHNGLVKCTSCTSVLF